MNNNTSWKKDIRSYDLRRDIAIPGDADKTIIFCAEQFIALAEESIAAHGIFTVALSGGSTPRAIYEKLASAEYSKKVDWAKVRFFWSDERCVPPDTPESNYYMAIQAGLSRLPIPQCNIYRMVAEGDVESEAEKYEELILNTAPLGNFDLVMLGMGEDGHTASLFPRTHGLHSAERLVVANYIPQKNTWRMTLTYKCINAARYISIYVIGKSKAAMLEHVLKAPYQPDELPIQRIGTPTHKALWIADAEAASCLRVG